jgi:hypothetical protein
LYVSNRPFAGSRFVIDRGLIDANSRYAALEMKAMAAVPSFALGANDN